MSASANREKVIDLDAIRGRLAKATPGPWWREGDNEYVYGKRRTGRPNGEGIATAAYYGKRGPDANADADLIAHAPTDLADLLVLLDEAHDLLLDVYTAKGNEDWFDRRDAFLARFPTPSPTDEEKK